MGFKFLGVFYELLKCFFFYKCSNCKKKKNLNIMIDFLFLIVMFIFFKLVLFILK